MITTPSLPGETLDVLERIVVSPTTGTFHPRAPETVTTEGEIVRRGQVIATVVSSGDPVAVTSGFTGFFMGLLAHDGERVREGEPVAWLRATEASP